MSRQRDTNTAEAGVVRTPADAMRAGVYARVSTRDKGQSLDAQLTPLLEYCKRRGWTVERVNQDEAAAGDMRRRREWRGLLEAAHRRQVDVVVVWRLDRAFRSTLDTLTTLRTLEEVGCAFVCADQPEIDTSTTLGRLLVTILAAVAELERDLIGARVRDGLAAARKRGRVLGRPRASSNARLVKRWQRIAPAVAAGDMSLSEAARRLGVARATVRELLRNDETRA